MADNTIAITAGSGTAVRTITNAGVDGGAHQQVFTFADSAGNLFGTTAAPLPAAVPSATVTGTITAANANPVSGTPTANSYVQLTLPDGESSWTAILGGTFSATTTVAFQCSIDGVTWYYTNGRRNQNTLGVNETTSNLSTDVQGGAAPTGGNPSLWKGSAGGVRYLRITCTTFTAADAITVQIFAGGGTGGTFLLGPIPAGSAYIGQVRLTDGALNATIKAASTPAVAADTAQVFALHPSSPLPAGTNSIGTVGLTPATLVVSASAAAAIGTATLPAAGVGLFHYITNIMIQRTTTAATTGAASSFVTGGANHGLIFQLPSDTQAIGFSQTVINYTPQLPLRVTAANTATTITTPLVAATTYRITVTYYTAP